LGEGLHFLSIPYTGSNLGFSLDMNDIVRRGIDAIETEVLRQYKENDSWDEAKDMIENLDAEKVFRVVLDTIRNPTDEMVEEGRRFSKFPFATWKYMMHAITDGGT
jgi:hypothetical protein